MRLEFANAYTANCLQALLHASVAFHRKLCVDWVPACDLEDATLQEVNFVSLLLFSSLLIFYLTAWPCQFAEPGFVQKSMEIVKGLPRLYLINRATCTSSSAHQQIYCFIGGRRHSSSRRLWRQRSWGKNPGCQVCPRKPSPVSRDMPRNANCCHWVCTIRPWPEECKQHWIRPEH